MKLQQVSLGDPGTPLQFFLFLTASVPEGAASKLKSNGVFYVNKRLNSRPENWRKIVDLLASDDVRGVVLKLTADDYHSLVHEKYRAVGRELLGAVAGTRHVAYVHEAVFTGSGERPSPQEMGLAEDDADYEMLANHFWPQPNEEARVTVNTLLQELGLDVVQYRTNADLSVLAASFVDEAENNLLFRLYVPHARLYAAEAEKVLRLFREWLGTVKGEGVREDGYETGIGRVYEFFGDGIATPSALTRELSDFSHFLDMSDTDPDKARDELLAYGVDKAVADDILRRYGRDIRRLRLDLRHEREQRLMTIRHKLESEFADFAEASELDRSQLDAITAHAVPPVTDVTTALAPAGRNLPTPITINQQFFGSVEGMVVQAIDGTQDLSEHAQALMRLVSQYGGTSTSNLTTAVHELEDPDARHADRLEARQRLKTFLSQLGGQVQAATVSTLLGYVSHKLGGP